MLLNPRPGNVEIISPNCRFSITCRVRIQLPYNLLSRRGLLEHDTQIARWVRMIGRLMSVGSIIIAV
jgi:hypothetical protein